ncbi:MAG: tetratricopeptide repeat protein [Rhodobacteraceae bacterium]|nr:tetratricopeptide repeat protein [Paracoccaceae bacterium]
MVTRPVRHFAGVLLALSLAACGNAGGPGTAGSPAIDPRGEAVDGLLVGHRLMEAGEPELALKAYLRAAAEDGVSIDTLSAIGSANLALGRLGQAEQILRRALEIDPNFVPALNNLGCVLMERDKIGEARVVFQQAYALDSGETDSIRDNLKLAIARTESPVYDEDQEEKGAFKLVRRDKGQFVLLTQL